MRALKMGEKEHAFTITELMLVIAVLGIITATAMPSVLNSARDYRLHSDASTVASLCNVARLRAAAEFAPHRINVSVTTGTYNMERLCGNIPSSVDSACTSPYAAFSAPQIESGTQYILPGNTFAGCRPAGPATWPGTIVGDPASCPSLVQFYFNTRGSPVDNAGNPLTNGGAVIYMTNQNGLVDALTMSVGGRASVWNWDTSASKWYLR
jgi:prepilin-type N-terminal cleavage/methylation domain-containing protein